MARKFYGILFGVLALIVLYTLLNDNQKFIQAPPTPKPLLSKTQLQTQTAWGPQENSQIEGENDTLAESESEAEEKAVVSRVIDGDTVELENGETIRLIGINTPEKGRPYYEEATNQLEELILGQEVVLEKDISEQDKYGRLLRYLWLGDLFINQEMVRLGYAYSYSYPPDVGHQEEILKAQEEAQENEVGLWAE